MKIRDIKSFPVWVGSKNQLLVKVETDEGVYGWGESGLSTRELAVAGAVKHYREFLIGKDAWNIGALWQEMYRSQYFEGGRVLTAAISAIDIALHDIKAKALGVPVYQLLGGRQRNYVPCFMTTSKPAEGDVVAPVRKLLDEGWTAIRTVPVMPAHMPTKEGEKADPRLFEPRESIGETARWLIQIRDELGKDFVLGIDYHHRLSVAETASFCQRLPEATLDFLEEPIRDEAPEAYAALRTMTGVPFAIGEEFASKWQFLPYIERGLTNFSRVDICNVGGFTEAMKVAGWCEAHYIDLMPHNPLGPVCTAASIHLAAAAPNFAWLESFAARDCAGGLGEAEALFPVRPLLDGTKFQVPEGPGLGVEVDEERVTRAAENFKFAEFPHLRRRDGSHTNG
jgi:galactonate dehydratase